MTTLARSTSSSDSMCCFTTSVIERRKFTLRSKSVVVQRSMSNKAHGSTLAGTRSSLMRIERIRRAVASSFTEMTPAAFTCGSTFSSERRTIILSRAASSVIAVENSGTEDGFAEMRVTKTSATITTATIPISIARCTTVHLDHNSLICPNSFLSHSFMTPLP